MDNLTEARANIVAAVDHLVDVLVSVRGYASEPMARLPEEDAINLYQLAQESSEHEAALRGALRGVKSVYNSPPFKHREDERRVAALAAKDELNSFPEATNA